MKDHSHFHKQNKTSQLSMVALIQLITFSHCNAVEYGSELCEYIIIFCFTFT